MRDIEKGMLEFFGILAIGIFRVVQVSVSGKRNSLDRVEPHKLPVISGKMGQARNWLLSLFTVFKKPDADTLARQAASEANQKEIITALKKGRLPKSVRERLEASRHGTLPWIATLTPAELLITRSYGIRPITAVSATCWLHYGYSWTNGHAQAWKKALKRLGDEAKAAGANAVLDVKMRTVPMDIENSMDFSLVGTAVKIDGLPPSEEPIIATVPALEFVKLLEADIIPTGIALGAKHQLIKDYRGRTKLFWAGNTECIVLSKLWKTVRKNAYYQLQQSVKEMGNGALAHINFSQIFEQEGDPKQFLARYIVIATAIDLSESKVMPHDFQMVVDMHAGKTPLAGTIRHNQSYASNMEEGAL